jgi:ABC-2 type transport system ATP-binding protein
MRQRLALARALLIDPPLLLLDEPTAALDPVASRDVRELLDGFAREQARSVLLCSHNLVEVQQLCDRVVVLEHGRVIADGAPAELAARLGIGRQRIDVEPAHATRPSNCSATPGPSSRPRWRGGCWPPARAR